MAEINCKLSQALLRKVELAHKLAYRWAKEEIESECAMIQTEIGRWFNLDDCICESDEAIAEAVEYLELMGLLERHPEHRNLVIVADAVPAAPTSAKNSWIDPVDETAAEVKRTALAEEFISTYIAPSCLDDDTKTLVAGNVRGFFSWIRYRGAFVDRFYRQVLVSQWCRNAFGVEAATHLPQRGIRLLEESCEAAQAAGVDIFMAHRLVDYVWSRPVGELSQELGGVGVTLLAIAAAAGMSADDCEAREVSRVLAKPLEHFAKRNAEKNAAGFNAVPLQP
ncbi:hypothetical protein [Terriglobus albidus]|uniref:hypothetical protein n=1 Tax=Terriglobus albidus TaxID=1592106 RepID=UPI0021DF6E18|nr:hypothetical protein [Terriglobus albidus]